MAHSLGILQSHYPGWRFRLPDCTADNGLHGRLVVGEPVPTKQVRDLLERLVDVEIVLRQRGAEVDRGTGANVLGRPLLALAHLIRVLASQLDAPPLSAGEMVTTGVIADAHPVAAGEIWTTDIRGLRWRASKSLSSEGTGDCGRAHGGAGWSAAGDERLRTSNTAGGIWRSCCIGTSRPCHSGPSAPMGYLEGRASIGPPQPVERIGVPAPRPSPAGCTARGLVLAAGDAATL